MEYGESLILKRPFSKKGDDCQITDSIENARLAVKRHLIAVLTVVVWLSILILSLATWPSLERMLLIKMGGAVSETVNYRHDKKMYISTSERPVTFHNSRGQRLL
jgi:hypothetical protein